mgnify:CR=1 FL=1
MTRTTTRRLRAGFAGALMAGTALGGLAFWQGTPANAQGNTAIVAPAITQPAVPLPGFGDLVARVRPAVVTITTTERATPASAQSPFPPGSEQDQMFRRHFGQQGEQPQRRPGHALGSGFLVDAQGHVVTNNHVVDLVADGGTLTVVFSDGKRLPGKVVGSRSHVAAAKDMRVAANQLVCDPTSNIFD